MENQKKILTRIQLINWHYFENEQISIHGSALLSGENAAGKSTVLDAIQLVLTTNTRRFNVAANEKGKRNLTGYVRCKLGNIGETYLRKNTVPANVALEFYEEKGDRYFVIGVHMLSADEESKVVTRWYVEECRLEDLSFIVENRPALAEEFKVKGKKIRYIDSIHAAKDRFKRRLGNLDDKFFDIIPKSLAFKPMDNVKEFINKFVLSEETIDVASLRENIETLSELESVLERTRKQLAALDEILEKYDAIEAKEHDILVNRLLLKIAGRDAIQQELEEMERDTRIKKQTMESNREQISAYIRQLENLQEQIVNLEVAIRNNESNKLVEETKNRIKVLQQDIEKNEDAEKRLKVQLKEIRGYLKELQRFQLAPVTPSELDALADNIEDKEKIRIVDKLESFEQKELEQLRRKQTELEVSMRHLNEEMEALQNRQKELEKQKLTYPSYAGELKEAVEKEFEKRGIRSNVYILAELLEITDVTWANAVEGYFHTQKFYLVVEPEYYEVTLTVYDRNRGKIHTAGLINTRKLPLDYELNPQSLAYVVKSENRYAKAYANYILGRVIRCENVMELEQYSIAITPECMLYQGYVVRHLNPMDYRDPFIGQNAYRVQLLNVKQEIEEKSRERSARREELTGYAELFDRAKAVNLAVLKLYLHAPSALSALREQLLRAKADLVEAEKDPTLIELNMKLEHVKRESKMVNDTKEKLSSSNSRLENQVEQQELSMQEKKVQLTEVVVYLEEQADMEGLSYREAEEKYRINRRSKSAKTIAENFAPRGVQLANEKEELLYASGSGLVSMQHRFNQEFNQDLLIGPEGMGDYRRDQQRLKSVEVVRYEEKLKQAKADCEEIFQSDFLSKMKEHIENARMEFKNLNKALDSIYYGDDSYHFKITFDKKKEGLYKMITSEQNQEGFNLWTSAFEAEYKEEMQELFEKLLTKDDNGQKIVEEYTDYRSYLDYDIEIRKRDGSVQRFSDIYGEKSGSETQVPYYVAIAASFYQLYRYGNSIRIMLLDEAFDKMDDERIQSMMDFFNGLGLQVILATPPSKIEVIGEKVDTVLVAIRVDQNSIVEEYDFE